MCRQAARAPAPDEDHDIPAPPTSDEGMPEYRARTAAMAASEGAAGESVMRFPGPSFHAAWNALIKILGQSRGRLLPSWNGMRRDHAARLILSTPDSRPRQH